MKKFKSPEELQRIKDQHAAYLERLKISNPEKYQKRIDDHKEYDKQRIRAPRDKAKAAAYARKRTDEKRAAREAAGEVLRLKANSLPPEERRKRKYAMKKLNEQKKRDLQKSDTKTA